MDRENEYKNLIAFHPGTYLSEIIDDLNITQAEFAQRVGTSAKTLSKIINGEEGVSPATAGKVARVTGVSVQTWLNLQASYDAKVEEIRNAQSDDEVAVSQNIDLHYLKKHHFIENKRYKSTEKIETLRQVLKVANLSQLADFNSAVSYRRSHSENDTKSIICSNTMLELATDLARNKTDTKYDKDKLANSFQTIKQLNLKEPRVFYPELTDILLQCGIVLVALPSLPGARLNGATKKFKNGSVVLLFTDRSKYADTIWFSIIHELGHIYYEDFYSEYGNTEEYKNKEQRADKFAADFFIPFADYKRFVDSQTVTRQSIVNFANKLKIIPSILVGRLQSDKVIGYTELNDLKVQYEVL